VKAESVGTQSLARGASSSSEAVLGALVPLTHSYVLKRLGMSDRALLPREIVPLATNTNITECVRILKLLEQQGRVRFHTATDLWSVPREAAVR
jgi:hypothetical protein